MTVNRHVFTKKLDSAFCKEDNLLIATSCGPGLLENILAAANPKQLMLKMVTRINASSKARKSQVRKQLKCTFES